MVIYTFGYGKIHCIAGLITDEASSFRSMIRCKSLNLEVEGMRNVRDSLALVCLVSRPNADVDLRFKPKLITLTTC